MSSHQGLQLIFPGASLGTAFAHLSRHEQGEGSPSFWIDGKDFDLAQYQHGVRKAD
jgi:hypothetical protein